MLKIESVGSLQQEIILEWPKGNMYFVNHTSPSKNWAENSCCLFEGDLPATPPDFMTHGQYNGTQKLGDVEVDVWWFPGPCFAYWNVRDKSNTPFQFFGPSAIGLAALQYYDFKPGKLTEDADLSLPLEGCDVECKPPVLRKKMSTSDKPVMHSVAPWPNWVSCN